MTILKYELWEHIFSKNKTSVDGVENGIGYFSTVIYLCMSSDL